MKKGITKSITPAIACIGGASGGHIIPAMIILEEMKHAQGGENFRFIWIGEQGGMDERIVGKRDDLYDKIYHVTTDKLRRYADMQTLIAPFRIFKGYIQSLQLLKKEQVRVVFSKGGYLSVPVCFAAKTLGIPIVLHESDALPGLANKIVGKLASYVCCTFEGATKFFSKKKILHVGPILSPEIKSMQESAISHHSSEEQQSTTLKPEAGSLTKLLVTCGSQGSHMIFEALYQHRFGLAFCDVHIVLGTGGADYKEKLESVQNFTTYDFMTPAEHFTLMQQSDVVIARSGSSIFELDAFGLPILMIPHEAGNGHQLMNAAEFEKRGHRICLESDLESELVRELETLIKEKQKGAPHFTSIAPKVAGSLMHIAQEHIS